MDNRILNALFLGLLMVSCAVLVSGRGDFIAGSPFMPDSLSRQPSMVPGVEAMRPVAVGQSAVIQDIISELKSPSPVIKDELKKIHWKPSRHFSGAVKNINAEKSVSEITQYQSGKKVATVSQFFDHSTGVLKATSLEIFDRDRISKRIDELYSDRGELAKRYVSDYDRNERLISKSVDREADGTPDQTARF